MGISFRSIRDNNLLGLVLIYPDGQSRTVIMAEMPMDADFMRCKENYMDFVANPCGFFVVETSFYHKVKDEYALLLNVPMFDSKMSNYHVKVKFENTKDFWRVYNHYKKLQKPYLNILLIAAEWVAVKDNSDYIAECTIRKSNQHAYI